MNRFKICSVEEMKFIDENAGKRGIDHLILMENAGSAIYSLVVKELGLDNRFLVVAGTGNNGGDALVAARRLHATGCDVKVFIIGDPEKYRDPARKMYEIAKAINMKIHVVRDENNLDEFTGALRESNVVIVGLIGIGLKGDVTGLTRKVIELINEGRKIVISVDIPSGIDGNSGRVRGIAIKSTYTVTFGLPKYGNILYPGYHYCGKLYTCRLSYPPELLYSDDIKVELNTPIALPERVKWGHKGTFGKILVISGARYYYGAPYYTSYSFLKAGGGYSRLAAPKSIIPTLASKCSEVVYHPMEETSEGSLALSNYDKILELIEEHGIDMVILGPGISLNEETQELARRLAINIDKPILIDGDGLTAISKNPNLLKNRTKPTILTPHPVEFTRISNISLSELLEDPIKQVRKTAVELNSYIVLKGAHSLIAYPNEYVYVNMTGNPGMAKAGMGDVLNGIIAAMYGLGLKDIGVATRMGVLIHGLAGDLVAKDIGEDGVTPDLVLEMLPKAVKILREKPEHIIEEYMPKEI